MGPRGPSASTPSATTRTSTGPPRGADLPCRVFFDKNACVQQGAIVPNERLGAASTQIQADHQERDRQPAEPSPSGRRAGSGRPRSARTLPQVLGVIARLVYRLLTHLFELLRLARPHEVVLDETPTLSRQPSSLS